MAVFVFYGYWGRAGCKVFTFLTYRRQGRVCAAFSVKNGSYLAILHSQLVFIPEKKKSLRVALERVEISLPARDLMPNRPQE